MIFADEADFSPLPFVTRTDALRGETPIVRAPLSHDHLSVISALTPDGRRFAHLQDEAVREPAVVAFLRQLLRQVRGNCLSSGTVPPSTVPSRSKTSSLLVPRPACNWSNSPAIPDLNPDEGVWNHRKRVELKHRCGQDLDELRWELGLAIRRLRRKPHVLAACFHQCGYL